MDSNPGPMKTTRWKRLDGNDSMVAVADTFLDLFRTPCSPKNDSFSGLLHSETYRPTGVKPEK
jgi:hypothetical protein